MNSRVIITNYSGKTEKLTIREHIPLHCQGHMLLLTFEMDRPRLQLYSKNDPDPHVLLAFLFFHATSFRKVYQNSVSQCFCQKKKTATENLDYLSAQHGGGIKSLCGHEIALMQSLTCLPWC